MIVLGIDPGVATIGFGVIRAERQKNTLIQYGVITTPPGIPLSNRLLQISNDMEELIRTFHPDEMAVEELFFTKNITTGIAVAHGRGVILLAAEKLGVPIFEYTPMQVKQAVVGYGGADKRQVMLMTQRLLSWLLAVPPKPNVWPPRRPSSPPSDCFSARRIVILNVYLLHCLKLIFFVHKSYR